MTTIHFRLGSCRSIAVCLLLASCGSKPSGQIQGSADAGSSVTSGGGQAAKGGAIGGTVGPQGGATGGTSAGGIATGATSPGGIATNQGGAGGGSGGAGKDGGGTDGGVKPLDALSTDAPAEGGTDAARYCSGHIPSSNNLACRTVADCGKPGWLNPACFSAGQTAPQGCIFAPTPAACPTNCSSDKDCAAGGTCVSYTNGCPQCSGRQCRYPPPPCIQSPDSCGEGMRCGIDGNCAPVPCTEGFVCAGGSRCSAASPRTDGHGCEMIPCNQGFVCAENTRCTAPDDRYSNGCTALPCARDVDCDCGFCVKGYCAADLGTCTDVMGH